MGDWNKSFLAILKCPWFGLTGYFVCLFYLILYIPSTIFQLYRDGSSWVEPVLSFLLKDTRQWRWWGSTRGPSVSSQALYHWATALPLLGCISLNTCLVCLLNSQTSLAQTPLNLYLLVSSADNFCKQLGPRSGPIKPWARSGSKLFDTLMVFLKEIFKKKLILKRISRRQKSMQNLPGGKKFRPC